MSRNSTMVNLELEVEVEYEEDEDGTKTYLDATCHTKVPITVEAWASHAAWLQLAGRRK